MTFGSYQIRVSVQLHVPGKVVIVKGWMVALRVSLASVGTLARAI
jgi:hypothetical protein